MYWPFCVMLSPRTRMRSPSTNGISAAARLATNASAIIRPSKMCVKRCMFNCRPLGECFNQLAGGIPLQLGQRLDDTQILAPSGLRQVRFAANHLAQVQRVGDPHPAE